MSSTEFNRWRAYAHLEPDTDTRMQYYAASICHIVYAMLSGKRSGNKSLSDFLIDLKSDLAVSSSEAQKRRSASVEQKLQNALPVFKAAGKAAEKNRKKR
jgi:hypothetical protein